MRMTVRNADKFSLIHQYRKGENGYGHKFYIYKYLWNCVCVCVYVNAFLL